MRVQIFVKRVLRYFVYVTCLQVHLLDVRTKSVMTEQGVTVGQDVLKNHLESQATPSNVFLSSVTKWASTLK